MREDELPSKYKNGNSENIAKHQTKDKSVKQGIGGWLILPAIGVLVGPIVFIFQMISYNEIFTDGTYDTLTASSTEVPLFKYLIWTEVTYNVILLSASLWLFYTMGARKKIFPKLYISIAIASLLFLILDTLAASIVFPTINVVDDESIKDIFKLLISTVVWVPYMLVSKRVKNTFIN